MPEGIAQIEKTALRLDLSAFFKSAFSVRRAVEGAVFYYKAPAVIKGALLFKSLIFNKLHPEDLLFLTIRLFIKRYKKVRHVMGSLLKMTCLTHFTGNQ